jgi:hypothetical protein
MAFLHEQARVISDGCAESDEENVLNFERAVEIIACSKKDDPSEPSRRCKISDQNYNEKYKII